MHILITHAELSIYLITAAVYRIKCNRLHDTRTHLCGDAIMTEKSIIKNHN